MRLGFDLDCGQLFLSLFLGRSQLVAKQLPELVFPVSADLVASAFDKLTSLLALLAPAFLSTSKFLHNFFNRLLAALPFFQSNLSRVLAIQWVPLNFDVEFNWFYVRIS